MHARAKDNWETNTARRENGCCELLVDSNFPPQLNRVVSASRGVASEDFEPRTRNLKKKIKYWKDWN